MTTQHIFLVDDHPMFRHGLRQFIEAERDLKVCGEAGGVLDALSLIQTNNLPDLVIIDVSLPGSGGIDLIKRLRVLYPSLACLVISMHDEYLYAERAVRAGAIGYVTKSSTPSVVIAAIRSALRGEITLNESVATSMLRSAYGGGRQVGSGYASLSDRELEVFELIGRGMTTRAISDALKISPKTVERHQAGIKDKLGIAHASELRRTAAIWVSETCVRDAPGGDERGGS